MKNVTKTIKLTAEITVTVALVTEENLGTEEWSGSKITRPCCEINVIALHKGLAVGDWLETATNPNDDDITHRIGKLYLRSESAKRVLDAVAEIEAMPYVVAWRAKVADAEKMEQEYYDHVARVDTMTAE